MNQINLLASVLSSTISLKILLTVLAISMSMSLIFSLFAPIIADKKNRSQVGWFILVYAFGLIPFIILLAIKKAPEVNKSIF